MDLDGPRESSSDNEPCELLLLLLSPMDLDGPRESSSDNSPCELLLLLNLPMELAEPRELLYLKDGKGTLEEEP